MEKTHFFLRSFLPLALLIAWPWQWSRGQEMRDIDQARAERMLEDIRHDVRKYYYDADLHGVDLDARFQKAKEYLGRAKTLNQAFGAIAWALDVLDDSHTFFIPPPRPYDHEYGWEMQMVGDTCVVTAVKPGSDAEAKELERGDVVLAVNGIQVTRQSMWKVEYLFNVLKPQRGLRLEVQKPSGAKRTVDVLAKIEQHKRVLDWTGDHGFGDFWQEVQQFQKVKYHIRHRYVEVGDELLIWKMPSFSVNDRSVDEGIEKARETGSLLLDLRGNPGGYQDTLLRLLGGLFDQDIEVGQVKGRKETEALEVDSWEEDAFTGRLTVLVDSETASAAEILARVVQLQERGKVLGDRTAGAVMQARVYDHSIGHDRLVFFATAITSADLIMPDGRSLEKTGVLPDEVVLPTPTDLARGRDPVLAYAAQQMGTELSPEKAGEFFPIEWDD